VPKLLIPDRSDSSLPSLLQTPSIGLPANYAMAVERADRTPSNSRSTVRALFAVGPKKTDADKDPPPSQLRCVLRNCTRLASKRKTPSKKLSGRTRRAVSYIYYYICSDLMDFLLHLILSKVRGKYDCPAGAVYWKLNSF
jgi:hypothetical protein